MSRYVIALMLVNIYSESLGNPMPSSVANGPVSEWLNGLTKHCQDSFINSQIDTVLKNCSVDVHPLHEKQVQCLSFYEINTRLCDAHLTVSEEAKAKLSEQISVEDLCVASKKWDVSKLDEYEPYQHYAQNIFHSTPFCVKVCSANDDDIMNINANFFCRYYQWGLDLLSQATGKESQPSAVVNSAVDGDINDIRVVTTSTGAAHAIDTNITQKSVIKPNVTNETQLPTKQKTDQGKTEAVLETTDTKNEVSGAGNIGAEPLPEIVKPPQKEQVGIPQGTLGNVNEGLDKPSAATVQPQLPEIQSPVKTPIVKEQLPQKTNVESKQQPLAPEDYSDLDDGNVDTLTDGGDDGDDMMSDPDMKQDFDAKNTNKKFETISSFSEPRDLFPNTIPDGFADDDDDHFFSFFLTAVIMAILIYILYHNKNKVSKVFFGLIVEGRQSGRRRNSRGHAYRRLDTLEQAMSTNTTTPPSTIIY